MKQSWKMLVTKCVVTALFTLTLATGFLVVNPEPAHAGACYDGAFNLPLMVMNPISNPGGMYFTPTYKTGANCRDINFRYTKIFDEFLDRLRYVYIRVCFHPSSGGISCQDTWKNYQDTYNWHTPATDVKDNTYYHLEFFYISPDEYTMQFESQVAD